MRKNHIRPDQRSDQHSSCTGVLGAAVVEGSVRGDSSGSCGRDGARSHVPGGVQGSRSERTGQQRRLIRSDATLRAKLVRGATHANWRRAEDSLPSIADESRLRRRRSTSVVLPTVSSAADSNSEHVSVTRLQVPRSSSPSASAPSRHLTHDLSRGDEESHVRDSTCHGRARCNPDFGRARSRQVSSEADMSRESRDFAFGAHTS